MGTCCSSTARSPIYKSIDELELSLPADPSGDNERYFRSRRDSATSILETSCSAMDADDEGEDSGTGGDYDEVALEEPMETSPPKKFTRPTNFVASLSPSAHHHPLACTDKVTFSPSAHGVLFHFSSPPSNLRCWEPPSPGDSCRMLLESEDSTCSGSRPPAVRMRNASHPSAPVMGCRAMNRRQSSPSAHSTSLETSW